MTHTTTQHHKVTLHFGHAGPMSEAWDRGAKYGNVTGIYNANADGSETAESIVTDYVGSWRVELTVYVPGSHGEAVIEAGLIAHAVGARVGSIVDVGQMSLGSFVA